MPLDRPRASSCSATPVPSPLLRPELRVLAQLLCTSLLLLVLGGLPPTARADTQVAVSTMTRTEVDTLLQSLQTRSSSSDPRYLQSNVWVDGSPSCFRCTLGPSVLAAFRATDAPLDNSLVNLSVATMDVAIRDHQRADGSYGPAAPGEGGLGIQTIMFSNELAWTYLVLGARLDFAHRTRWSAALTKSADWLIRDGLPTYYVNGNINLALSMNLDLTARITRLSRFRTAADNSLAFTLAPPQNRWPGFGLKYTKQAVYSDGRDGAAYLAETGGGKPGFDAVYGLFQTDMASMWFLLTRDEKVKRLTNLLLNQLMPRVRQSDWTIDVSGGTRRSTQGVRYAFNVSALAVVALKAGRSDLQGLVRPQVTAALVNYRAASQYVSPGLSYNYGIELAVIYLAVASTVGT